VDRNGTLESFTSLILFDTVVMHRAFQLDEIVTLIAAQVAAIKRTDVVKLARACRTLAKPSLDILWSNHQHEFLPLIMCLPRDCFVLDDDGFESLYVSAVLSDRRNLVWRLILTRLVL
jgi:hypothetical protein